MKTILVLLGIALIAYIYMKHQIMYAGNQAGANYVTA